MKTKLRRKWTLYLIQRHKNKSNMWFIVWLICALLFFILYSIHKTEGTLVGIFISLFAAFIWQERKGFCEIIEEQEGKIRKLTDNK